jgi:hypothetical protein
MKSRVIQDDPNTGEDQTGDTANLLEKHIEPRDAESERGAADEHKPVGPSSKGEA